MKENPRDSLDKLLTLIRKFSEIEIKRQKSIVTGKFGLGVRNEAGQRLIEFCQENTLVIANGYRTNVKSWIILSLEISLCF